MTLDRQRALFYYKPPPPPPPPPAGEAVFVANGQAASRYQTFIVPDRITSISAVVVSYASHAPGDVIKINSSGERVRIIWGPNRSYPNSALDI